MKKVFKDRWNKKIGGVCGGLGHYFNIDPTIIRLLAVFLCVLTGVLPVLVVYILAWIVMPEGPAAYIEITTKKLYRSRRDRKVAGICGGLAEFLGVDSTLVRIAFLVVLFVTAIVPVIVSYIIGSLIIPEKPSTQHS